MLAGFVHLVASQILTRLLTFGLNLATARSLTPEAYGVSTIQFHLINTTILFLAREGLRRACLRIDAGAPGATRRVLRLAALAVPAGALLASGVTAALLHSVGPDGDKAYRRALVMQGLAAFVELLAEPLYILAACRMLFGLRVGVEATAQAAKGALTLALVRRPGLAPPIAFSWAQLAYAGVTLAGYAAYFLPRLLLSARSQGSQRGAGRQRTRRGQQQQQQQQQQAESGDGTAAGLAAAAAAAGGDGEILRLAGTFTLQAAEKLVLAEGSKMAAAAFQGAAAQGVYGLVAGLGSLVVRTLFQPLEEAAFLAFSREQGQGKPTPARLRRQARLLSVLVRGITGVGLLAAAFGPGYAHLALLLLYGPRWAGTGAPPALGAYSQYLALLAANGILEAFVHAVADARQLHASNAALVGFTAAHAALSAVAVQRAGALGLIAADAANMGLRIAYCLAFARRRFAGAVPGFSPRQLLPSAATVGALAVAAALTCASRVALMPGTSLLAQAAAARGIALVPPALAARLAAQPLSLLAAAHVGVGAACLAAVAAVMWRHERGILAEARALRRQKGE